MVNCPDAGREWDIELGKGQWSNMRERGQWTHVTGDAGDASLLTTAALNVILSLLFVLSFSRQGDRSQSHH